MFTCTYFVASLCVVAAFELDDLNVGTTLFEPSDVKKTHWTTTELSLLRARRHFQALMPQPSTVTINDKFAKTFLTFVKDSYTFAKKASKDADTEKIMNAALSDTLGGFLKVWVLPVIKFAYYGGTVSQAEATKIFRLYEDIKLCLNTNGTTWKLPNPNLLSFMSIKMAPVRAPNSRRAQNSCDNIAFFEDTANGLGVPVPKVFWNKNAEYIFVPLKNISIVPLRDTFSNSLLRYYDSAKDCIKTHRRDKEEQLEDEANFEKRFQGWLEKEIVPHLNDDCLYPALGSVLTLVNKSISLIDAMVEALDANNVNKVNYSQRWLADLHILVSSKKMLLVIIVLMLEFMCCIPTLFCLFYSRYRKPKKGRCRHDREDTSIYVDYETYKDLTGAVTGHCGTQYSTSVKCVSIQPSTNNHDSINSKPRENHAQSLKNEFGTIGETTKVLARSDTFNKNDCATKNDSIKMLAKKEIHNEQDDKKAKSQGAGTTSNFSNQTRPRYFDSQNISCINSSNAYYNRRCSEIFSSEISNNMGSDASLVTVQSLEPNKTVTIFKNSHNYRKIETITCNKSTQETAKCTSAATDVIKELISKVSKCQNEHILSQEMLVASTLLDVVPANQPTPENMYVVETAPSRTASSKTSKSRKVFKGLNKKLGGFPKKYVEIKIDGHRDIAFDIGNGETVEYTYKTKQSKIPKRVNEITLGHCNFDPQPSNSSKLQCLIPRRKTLDEHNIDNSMDKKSSPRSEVRKLNSTL